MGQCVLDDFPRDFMGQCVSGFRQWGLGQDLQGLQADIDLTEGQSR
jgi:hypothetical protein